MGGGFHVQQSSVSELRFGIRSLALVAPCFAPIAAEVDPSCTFVGYFPPPENPGHIPRQGSTVWGGGERPYVPYTDFANAPRGCGGRPHHPFQESLEILVPLVECATPRLGVLAANGTETLNTRAGCAAPRDQQQRQQRNHNATTTEPQCDNNGTRTRLQ